MDGSEFAKARPRVRCSAILPGAPPPFQSIRGPTSKTTSPELAWTLMRRLPGTRLQQDFELSRML